MRWLVSLLLLLFLIFPKSAFGAQNQFINLVYPVRGSDFFQLEDGKPLDNLKLEWQETQKRNLAATWLIRPDSLFDPALISFFKSLPQSQELGLFMEITPKWTSLAQIKYRNNINWHAAGAVFLTGYEVDERHKLIDAAFEKFRQAFGHYPKSVGAWWIDAGSLSYMKQKYGVVANMDVADQYTTDNYQIWGQYWSTPFYPAAKNALIPALGEDQKTGVVTIQWASRDPYNSYGNGVLDSTYSVQANDYANKKYHQLTTDYFKKLLSIYLDNPYSELGQVTVGLENDFSWKDYGEEFIKQLEVVADRKHSGTLVTTMSDFAQSYVSLYPNLSPTQLILANDPLGSSGKVIWFQNSRFRLGWFFDGRQSVIKDLRQYINSQVEPCLDKRCDNLNLAMLETRNIDAVSFNNSWIIDEGKISELKLENLGSNIQISYTNQSGHQRTIKLTPFDIFLDNHPQTISGAISDHAYIQTDKIEDNKSFNYQLKNGLINTILDQIAKLAIFIIFVILAFYFPGLAVVKSLSFDDSSKLFLSFPVGMVLFTLVSLVAGYLRQPYLVIGLPLVAIVLTYKNIILPRFTFDKNFKILSLLIAIGSLSWLLTTIKNGLIYDYGLGFWGPHGHDAIWHLGLIEGLKNGLPLQNPIYSGMVLKNYHFFYDLLLSQTSLLTKIPALDLYFRLFPFLITILIGIAGYLVAKEWFKDKLASYLAVFFIYFGGSFGWIISYFKNGNFGGETMFWAQQAISTFVNPPFAISLLLFASGFYLLIKFIEEKKYSNLVPVVILWGSLIEFKAYAGILTLGSLAILVLFSFWKKRTNLLGLFLSCVVLSALIFVPTSGIGSSILIFSPFWFIHSMVDSPDRLGWVRLSLTRMAGWENKNYFKFLSAEGLGFVIFIAGNLGTRILGLYQPLSKNYFNQVNLFVTAFLGLSLLFPLIFIQAGSSFNTIQFFYYFLFIFNFLAAVSLAKLINKFKLAGLGLGLLIVILTIPTTWDTLNQYLPSRPPAMISQNELAALSFLKKQPDGVVLGYYDNKFNSRFTEPKPLYAYQSSSYITAFSGKKEYFADSVNLEIIGIDYKGRLQDQKDIFAFREPEIVKKIMHKNNIKYLYVPKVLNVTIDQDRFSLERIYQNNEVEIFKANL